MLCDICQAKQAKIFYTEIVNGQKKEQHLCEDCASEYTALPLSELMGGQQLPIGSILSGILSKYAKDSVEGESGGPAQRIDVQCPECGMTESDFLKMGRLGCPVCYSAFSNLITKNFKTMQGGLQHTGKEPVHAKFIEISEDMPKKRVPLTPEADGVEENGNAASEAVTGEKPKKGRKRKTPSVKAEKASAAAGKAAASENTDGVLTELKAQLQEALAEEDYERAAGLRDRIRAISSEADGKKQDAGPSKTKGKAAVKKKGKDA